MRYTEARMEKLATEMVRDINLNTVDFGGNYDGSEKEQKYYHHASKLNC